MKYLVLIGRIFYSFIFLMTLSHFSPDAIGYAQSKGVPAAPALVPLSGIIAFLGALSIILGYKAKLGACLIILFLVPVTFFMHDFWNMVDPMQAQMQMANFMKNLSMAGAALIIIYFGSGPLSIDLRKKI